MNLVAKQLFGEDWDLAAESSLSEIAELLVSHKILLESNLPAEGRENVRNGRQRLAVTASQRQKLLPCCDSRLLEPCHIFVALSGQHFDGHKFLAEALELGIPAIVYQSELVESLQLAIQLAGTVAFRVQDSRQALALLSAHCFGYPSQDLDVIGVTGTDGKTSIAYLCYQILCCCQQDGVGLLSTFGLDFGTGLQANPVHQTTPESLIVQRALARMRAQGCRYAVLEASSHGLSRKTARLLYVQFSAAIFCNLSPEHLEFHGSMEVYAEDKSRLFSALKPGGYAVWNADEVASEQLYAASGQRQDICHLGYSLDIGQMPIAAGEAKAKRYPLKLERKAIPYQQLWRAQDLKLRVDGSRFTVTVGPEGLNYSCDITIPGSIYVANVLGALALCGAVNNLSLEQLLLKLSCNSESTNGLETPLYSLNLSAPKGRMELVPSEVPFTVVVDYAHSPGSFSRLLPEMKALMQASAAANTSNPVQASRMLLLFGSAGQRDTQKRALQGAVAAQYADIIVLCDEDPRDELSMTILRDIQKGICTEGAFVAEQNLFLIPDRRKAMAKVFALARPRDLVLLLGKGHETSIILAGGQELPWDERKVAEELLLKLF